MEDTVPGSMTALPTSMVPGDARAWVARQHGPEMAHTRGTKAPFSGAEKVMSVNCAFRAGEYPTVILLYLCLC